MSCDVFSSHVNSCNQCQCGDQIRFVVEERGRKYQLDNPDKKEICKIKIDGCYIKDPIPRCDYLFVVCGSLVAFLVELKGSDLLHAIEQIDQTLTTLNHHLANQVVHARIVLTRMNVPGVRNNPKIINMCKRLREKRGTLVYRSREIVESVVNPIQVL